MNPLAQTVYDLLNSTAFWIILGICGFICIAWVERWKPVLSRLAKLVTKPVIFRSDPEPESVPFYPRGLLEDAALAFRDTLRRPFSDLIRLFKSWVAGIVGIVHDRAHPIRTPVYLIFLVCFAFFVLADAISIANTLAVLGITFGSVPYILTRFDIAVFGGSLLALIIGMLLVIEYRGNEGRLVEVPTEDGARKSLTMGIAMLVALLSFLTLVAWALDRMIALDDIAPSPLLNGALEWVLYGVVPINSALSAAVCFSEAVIGLYVVAIIVSWLAIAALSVLDYASTILGTLLPFLFDLLYRIFYMALDILQWLVTTPIHAILWPFRIIYSMFLGPKASTPSA